MGIKCIISLTSHNKSRLENLSKYLYESIYKYSLQNEYKVVLTLYKEDIQYITDELQALIDNTLLELIVSDIDLKSHLKYFYTMQKYKDLPIITIDDDSIYPANMFDYMYNEYIKNPNLVLCRSCQEFTYTNHQINPTNLWRHSPLHNISYTNHAEGYAGVLYPPNCLDISDELIPEILDCIKSDDIYLSILEIRKKIQIYYLPNMRHQFVLSTKGENAISLTKDIVSINNSYVKKFEADFNTIG